MMAAVVSVVGVEEVDADDQHLADSSQPFF
jgi:hypothetical protein